MYEDMFDDEFMTEEEIENAFDSLVSLMGEQIEKEEALPHIINPMVVQKVCYAYKYLKYLFKDDENTTVTYELNAPYVSMGSISIESEGIVFENVQKISDIIKLASNVEVYSKTNGKFQIDFTFHGVAVPIK